MGEATKPYRVLYRKTPAWLVGEPQESAVIRRSFVDVSTPDQHYPDDYAGHVISVKSLSHNWRPGDTADPSRALVTIDLTLEEAARLRVRELKLGTLDRPVPVTLDDHYGATASTLRTEFGLTNLDQMEQQSSGQREAFALRAAELRRGLAKNVVYSGVGLYEVGPTKLYSTIQSALAQLWADQGSTLFTASQYIRVFANTYDENVAPDTSLQPDRANGYLLFIEGDPATSRESIIVAPSGGARAIYLQSDGTQVRHMKVTGTPSTNLLETTTGARANTISDCTFVGAVAGLRLGYSGNLHDCTITVTADVIGLELYIANDECVIERCVITGVGKGASTTSGIYAQYDYGNIVIDSCVVSGFSIALQPGESRGLGALYASNNVFFDCMFGTGLTDFACDRLRVFINNTFKDVDTIHRVIAWPEETSTRTGPRFLQRNNCYHNYTTFGDDGSGTKTYAEWIALNRVDAAGDLDATDPLLMDPDSGDFSLQAGSPCRHAGHGSGVVKDYLGTPFDPNNPDIGAWSSGPNGGGGGGQQTRYLLEEA